MKHSLERSRSSRSSSQMEKKDTDELIKLLKGISPEEILEVKRVIDKIERERKG